METDGSHNSKAFPSLGIYLFIYLLSFFLFFFPPTQFLKEMKSLFVKHRKVSRCLLPHSPSLSLTGPSHTLRTMGCPGYCGGSEQHPCSPLYTGAPQLTTDVPRHSPVSQRGRASAQENHTGSAGLKAQAPPGRTDPEPSGL